MKKVYIMSPISKSQDNKNPSSLSISNVVVLLSSLIVGSIFSANVFADEVHAKHVAVLSTSDHSKTTDKKSDKQAADDEQKESITYSLDDGSQAGPYGDGVYGN
jgi:hypothetical protein